MASTPNTSKPDGEDASTSQSWMEKYGLNDMKDKIVNSPYSGCARESFMWGIATGTAMGIHRIRMGSRAGRSINFAFGTALVVIFPSYYFCVKNREHQDKMVELMMKANAFEPQDEMPEPIPIEEHPFLEPKEEGDESNGDGGRLGKVYEYFQKSRKDWEKPAPMAEDASKVFKEVDDKERK